MDEIKAVVRFKFHPGQADEWKRLIQEELEIARTDRGTIQFEVFMNEDQSEAVVFERYRDSASASEHLSKLGDIIPTIMATSSVSGEFMGTPNADLQGRLQPDQIFYPWKAM